MENKPVMSKDEAIRELAKVGLAYKILQTGNLHRLSEKDFNKFMEWLN